MLPLRCTRALRAICCFLRGLSRQLREVRCAGGRSGRRGACVGTRLAGRHLRLVCGDGGVVGGPRCGARRILGGATTAPPRGPFPRSAACWLAATAAWLAERAASLADSAACAAEARASGPPGSAVRARTSSVRPPLGTPGPRPPPVGSALVEGRRLPRVRWARCDRRDPRRRRPPATRPMPVELRGSWPRPDRSRNPIRTRMRRRHPCRSPLAAVAAEPPPRPRRPYRQPPLPEPPPSSAATSAFAGAAALVTPAALTAAAFAGAAAVGTAAALPPRLYRSRPLPAPPRRRLRRRSAKARPDGRPIPPAGSSGPGRAASRGRQPGSGGQRALHGHSLQGPRWSFMGL